MRLRDRLSLLSSPAGGVVRAINAEVDDRSHRIAQLRTLIGEVVARGERERPCSDAPRAAVAAPRALPMGELRPGPHGTLRAVERWLPPDHCHGRVRVSDALDVQAVHVAALAHDRTLAEVRLRELLILDTETTGLAGGTGTVPFLVGLAWFDGDGDGKGNSPVLKVEQLFLENLGQEAPLLHHLAERIARASMLVTYNGKAFDWPLLRARFVLSRIAVPELPPHLDLLHCARRVWSSRLPSVRLTEVERSVLGFWRQDDVDGSEIPGLYHGYLRGGDPRALLPVLTHNEHDLVALAALLARLGRLYGDGDAADARDLLACARLALRARDTERAVAFAERAAGEAEDAALRAQALLLRGRLHVRAGERTEAIQRYREVLEHAATGNLSGAAHLALARLHERGRELALAYAHARASEAVEGPHAHGRRLGRLRRRLLEAAS